MNYTDHHDVDDDVRTIPQHGGDWSMVGITKRAMSETYNEGYTSVASRLIYLSQLRAEATRHPPPQFVDIYNLHGKNIAPVVPFILYDITPSNGCDVI